METLFSYFLNRRVISHFSFFLYINVCLSGGVEFCGLYSEVLWCFSKIRFAKDFAFYLCIYSIESSNVPVYFYF